MNIEWNGMELPPVEHVSGFKRCTETNDPREIHERGCSSSLGPSSGDRAISISQLRAGFI